MKFLNSRTINVIFIVGVFAGYCSIANGEELVSYADYKFGKNLPSAKYDKLINSPFCSGLKLVGMKKIELLKSSKPLLFVEYESPDTDPPSKSVCVYMEIERNKFKPVLHSINLFYGEYRGNGPYEYHELYIGDINKDGNKEIIVFEKLGDESYSLSGIYFYLEEKKQYVFSSLIDHRIPKATFNISQAETLLKKSGYTFSPGMIDLVVSIE